MSDLHSIHHVQVAMPADMDEAARHFYGELLGFREIEKPETLQPLGGVWFATGSIDLHIGVEEPFSPAKKAHVAYQVNDLEAAEESLRSGGFPVRPDDRLPGYRRFYTDDPFGNRVEILTPLGPRQTASQ